MKSKFTLNIPPNIINPKATKLEGRTKKNVSSGPKVNGKNSKASGIPKLTVKGGGGGQKGSKGPNVASTVSSDSDFEFKRPAAPCVTPPQSPVRGFRSRSPMSPAGTHRLPAVVGSRPSRPR